MEIYNISNSKLQVSNSIINGDNNIIEGDDNIINGNGNIDRGKNNTINHVNSVSRDNINESSGGSVIQIHKGTGDNIGGDKIITNH